MSDERLVFDTAQRRETYHGIAGFPPCWALKLFVVSVSDREGETVAEIMPELESMVASLETRRSPEFEYGRFGFAVVHFGRRGTCISITHFGGWGRTFEVFSSVWYRYRGANGSFGLLDDLEPALCWFERARTLEEIRTACDLAGTGVLAEIREQYLTSLVVAPRSSRDAR